MSWKELDDDRRKRDGKPPYKVPTGLKYRECENCCGTGSDFDHEGLGINCQKCQGVGALYLSGDLIPVSVHWQKSVFRSDIFQDLIKENEGDLHIPSSLSGFCIQGYF
jgi:hypothetical protein